MHTRRETRLCRYHYDPLDRLVDCIPSEQANTQRFYLKDRLTTEIQGAVQRSIMQHDDQLLAQQQCENGTVDTRLLAPDQQRSVLNQLDIPPPRTSTYTPYGYRSRENGLLSLLGFNGERQDPVTGCYLLGNGYRSFNPVLMRFNSPDSRSPFGEGGLNTYAYCLGDPINRMDKTGHASGFFAWLMMSLKRTPRDAYTPLQRNSTSSSLVSLSTLAGTAGASIPGTGVSGVLLKMKPTKVIKAIKDPIVRNQAKLDNVKTELINLNKNPDLVVSETVSQNYESVNFMKPYEYENIVREAIPKRIIELGKEQSRYVKKIHKLQEKSSRVRQQPTSNH
jgi:RHS repeat-associated protein